jgi:hypothetical protein
VNFRYGEDIEENYIAVICRKDACVLWIELVCLCVCLRACIGVIVCVCVCVCVCTSKLPEWATIAKLSSE